MKLLLVTGTFDKAEGKSSHFGNVIREEAEKRKFDIVHYNGGHLTDFNTIMNDIHKFGVIVWMPNISNDEKKMLPVIKKVAPTSLLISSKRVIEKGYDEFDIVGRLLKTHSNLGIMITKDDDKYGFTVMDPLANRWCNKAPIEEAMKILFDRVEKINKYHRLGSSSVGPRKNFKLEDKFINLVKEYGELFDGLIRAVNPDRLLGNASTRCMHGFPVSETLNDDGTSSGNLAISRRNIDKTIISADGFIEVEPCESSVKYFGDDKPSVDSPVQIRLFNHYPNVKYILHGHVYVKDALITSKNIPCGFIEEAEEIKQWFSSDSKNFAVNLKGHGCLLMAGDLEWLENMKSNLVSRPFPEDCQW